MTNSIKLHVQRISNEIKESLSSRPRQVEPGCLIKVPLVRIIGEANASGGNFFVYGVVGQKRYHCKLSESRAYDVIFSLDGVAISRTMFPVFTVPVFENDMQILRFPDQNASIDDPNVDDFFHKVDGKWISRSSNTIKL